MANWIAKSNTQHDALYEKEFLRASRASDSATKNSQIPCVKVNGAQSFDCGSVRSDGIFTLYPLL